MLRTRSKGSSRTLVGDGSAVRFNTEGAVRVYRPTAGDALRALPPSANRAKDSHVEWMWSGCTPILDELRTSLGREILDGEIPGVAGEVGIEPEGFQLSVLPAGERGVEVGLRFDKAVAESETVEYTPLGPATLRMEQVRSVELPTPGTNLDPLWKRVLHGEERDEVLRMLWDEEKDVLHVRDAGTQLSCRGGVWRWDLT